MIFSGARRKARIEADLLIDNIKIERVNNTKFLGVVLDHHLDFSDHLQFTKGKVSRGVGILHKAKIFLNNI